ncbi:MAG TPA: AraC family transcriptional regulator [Candidatus Mediterraneibacter faecipullorum]|uniref:Stage 0 sporulation protein A homolog n=1 Tax=Candidatus Mediterraneibacter faecipullorum TaxID=2838670 RepID=A0A9D2NM51_9FIRM|nr:AraC family transcriptional regulator [Candidatus Mediterraneibacter faecipullorum]
MLKVLIIDDEVKVCRLIQCLINWKELGLEVVGTCHDGFLAMDAIRLYMPDIIITDIRMPGCDGLTLIKKAQEINPYLHFIIISGYGQFDYAQKAIQYGVSDYLLKPIKEKELKNTLISIIEKHNNISIQNQKTKEIQNELSDTQQRIRSNFINELLLNPRLLHNYSDIMQLNQTYYTHFDPSSFALACISFDAAQPELSPDVNRFIQTKIMSMAAAGLQSFHENLVAIARRQIFLLVNDAAEVLKKDLYPALKSLRSSILALREICPSLHILIAQSNIRSSFHLIPECFEEITICLHEKVISGGDSVFLYSNLPVIKQVPDDFITSEFRSRFMTYIETFQCDAFSDLITQLSDELRSTPSITGHFIYQVYSELTDLFLFSIKQYKITIASDDILRQHWDDTFSTFESISDAFGYLTGAWIQLLKDHHLRRQKSQSKSVLLAKQYINEHYAEPLTLDQIGQIVGLNPSYFSNIFRKESGCTFTEYLTEIRMKNARQLITDTDLEIIEIAEQTGFHDMKYFSRCFRKITGMTPSAYRKLFS